MPISVKPCSCIMSAAKAAGRRRHSYACWTGPKTGSGTMALVWTADMNNEFPFVKLNPWTV
eukprot:scaffold420391_cov21-Prasinocladus_malaysianus.AAC.1